MKNRPIQLTALCILSIAISASSETTTTLKSWQLASMQFTESLEREAQAAIQRGIRFLIAHQNEQGHWSNEDFPALTALPLWALMRGGRERDEHIDKGVAFILSSVHEDGSIYRTPSEKIKGGGLVSYNTALCMVALDAMGDPTLRPVILKARRFLANHQYLGDDVYRGGMGYDANQDRAYTDLSNSYMAYEAMRITENLKDFPQEGDRQADLDWRAALEFIQRCHNHPAYNDQPWTTDHPDHEGGFVYNPENTRAGTFTDKDGVVRFRSFGSMTYAGMLSYIYADVDKNDPRVQSAFAWARKHWTLEENPGTGQEGLYYYYHVLSKGLSAYGEDHIRPAESEPFNWRVELTKKLLSLQKIDEETGFGYWVNDMGRYWESDKILVTSYSLLALELALRL